MAKKQIRDPIYNYIMLDNPFVKLINTPEFQRLRNIRQTSYEALYPSALHNRFVHSLGVFHLGEKAIDYFWTNIQNEFEHLFSKNKWEIVRTTFLYACILHDVGHSPFSHTGENYYKKGILFEVALVDALVAQKTSGKKGKAIQQFCADLEKAGNKTGSPHEAMSALIGLDLCRDANIDSELFVRCIIGLRYQVEGKSSITKREMAVLNAVIGLLNGELIDVDKLDYTIRDAYVTGYKSLSIDLDRLLAGYTLCKMNEEYRVGYKRGSLSVIENVIYANDLERRWIQNHPTILYDGQLVDFLIGQYNSYMKEQYQAARKTEKNRRETEEGTTADSEWPETIGTVFTKASLSQEGFQGINPPLKLLCDADVISYVKNINDSKAGQHYLNREVRLKPLWKAEASFTPLVEDFGAPLLQAIQRDFKNFLDTLRVVGSPFVDDRTLAALEELAVTDKAKDIQRAISICKIFKEFKTEEQLPDFDFMLVQSKSFRSGYLKLNTEDGPIMVELDTGFYPLEQVMSVQAKEVAQKANDFFCVYTTKDNLLGRHDLAQKFFDCLRRHYRRDPEDTKKEGESC